MTVTKDLVLARKAQLEGELKGSEQRCQALYGAIQDCDFWLAKLEEEDKPVEPSG